MNMEEAKTTRTHASFFDARMVLASLWCQCGPLSEGIGETYGGVFLELPVAVAAVTLRTVVEAGIDEDV